MAGPLNTALMHSHILVNQTLHWCQGVILVVYALAQALVVLYSSQRYLTLWRWWRGRSKVTRPPAPAGEWPRVTVQLPLYNERTVVERLIDAVAELDYPSP